MIYFLFQPTTKEEEIKQKHHEECEKISGLDAEAFYKALESDSDIEKVKEHSLCIGEKQGLIDDGKVDPDKVKQYLEKEFPGSLSHFDEKCFENQPDVKDTAYGVSKCISEYFKKMKH